MEYYKTLNKNINDGFDLLPFRLFFIFCKIDPFFFKTGEESLLNFSLSSINIIKKYSSKEDYFLTSVLFV